MSYLFESSGRYRDLWDKATSADHGPVIPTEEEPYVEGSLRPRTTSLAAEIGGRTIHITNGEAAFLGDEYSVQQKLSSLEALITE